MRVLSGLAALLVVLLLLPPATSAQATLGFQGGLSLATLGGSDAADEVGYKAGLGIGALVDIPVSDMVSIQPEVNFMQKGAKETEDGVDIKFKLDYIEIPVFLKINVPAEGTVAPFLVVGPALGIKVGCKISGEEDGVSVDIDCDEAGIDLKGMDLGAMFGAGFAVAKGPGNLFVTARYNFGLMSIHEATEGYEEEDIKNRAFSFMAGYSFPVGG
jgi:hypothetical protein